MGSLFTEPVVNLLTGEDRERGSETSRGLWLRRNKEEGSSCSGYGHQRKPSIHCVLVSQDPARPALSSLVVAALHCSPGSIWRTLGVVAVRSVESSVEKDPPQRDDSALQLCPSTHTFHVGVSGSCPRSTLSTGAPSMSVGGWGVPLLPSPRPIFCNIKPSSDASIISGGEPVGKQTSPVGLP